VRRRPGERRQAGRSGRPGWTAGVGGIQPLADVRADGEETALFAGALDLASCVATRAFNSRGRGTSGRRLGKGVRDNSADQEVCVLAKATSRTTPAASPISMPTRKM